MIQSISKYVSFSWSNLSRFSIISSFVYHSDNHRVFIDNFSFSMSMRVKAQVIFATDSQRFLFGYTASWNSYFLDKTELREL